MEVLKNMLI